MIHKNGFIQNKYFAYRQNVMIKKLIISKYKIVNKEGADTYNIFPLINYGRINGIRGRTRRHSLLPY